MQGEAYGLWHGWAPDDDAQAIVSLTDKACRQILLLMMRGSGYGRAAVISNVRCVDDRMEWVKSALASQPRHHTQIVTPVDERIKFYFLAFRDREVRLQQNLWNSKHLKFFSKVEKWKILRTGFRLQALCISKEKVAEQSRRASSGR